MYQHSYDGSLLVLVVVVVCGGDGAGDNDDNIIWTTTKKIPTEYSMKTRICGIKNKKKYEIK